MPANQYSNSPYDPTENRLVAVISTISPSASIHSGASTRSWRILAPATASKPTTITQKYQYSQADREARPAAERPARVVGERTGRGVGRGHLAEHPHHQDDQHAGDQSS